MSAAGPRVTVVIPTYNHAAYLGEAVESALGQTERGVQVVVVDDGSTDDTPSLVAARWRDRVRYVRQDNRGLAAARNAGLACAEGEYVTFLDADDFLVPASVERRVAALAANAAAGWVFSDLFLTDERGQVTRRCSEAFQWNGRRLRGDLFEELLLGNFIPVHAVLFRRACLDRTGGFDPSFTSYAEDYEHLLRLAREVPAEFVEEPLGYYRIHPGTMSTNRIAMTRAMLRIVERVERESPAAVARIRPAWRQRKATLLLQAATAPGATPSRRQRLALAWRAVRTRPVQGAAYRVLLRLLTQAPSRA